ncbi:wall-associated receptor kinase-like 8 [Silene latifolia]|uniref:wall-associated receptor kinase-like 8 n=1 Tax=Silene latifolia TaxID=37657 RepID=UPI003D77B6FF
MVLLSTTILVLLFTLLLLILSNLVNCSYSVPTTMLTATNLTKPGCQRKCGNLTIPYPFGIKKGCAMGDEYLINCYEEDNKVYTPQFLQSTSQVMEISETQVIVAAGGPLAESCNSSKKGNTWGHIDLSGMPYALSSTGNKFMVIGCHHYGLIEARTAAGRKVFSCVALCTENEDLLDRSCAGIGCCQVPLPKGLQSFSASLELIRYNTSISSGSCSYSFIVERSSFEFHGAIDLKGPGFIDRLNNMPVALDWFVAKDSCRSAKKNSSSYACKKNTICVDLNKILDVMGYRCKCINGYEGNPYLSPGCTDIDECANDPCDGICKNVQGGYNCHCPSGFYGDGRKDGVGCRARSLRLVFILGLCVGLGTILLLMGGYWAYLTVVRRKEMKQKTRNFKRNGGLLLKEKMMSPEGRLGEQTRLFTANELEKATDQFNEDRILGRGGQGIVYKGMLSDGNLVAIKKHKIGSNSSLGDFINEIAILSEINHRNIVKLIGCCLETDVPLLVYEFVPNGVLSKFVHDPQEEFPITWEMRLQIALDVAGALTYLHSASSKPIFHKDIKTSNILLDAKYRAKLSDFGTSRSIAIDQTHLTTRVQGTFGYLDPQYFQSNKYTEKSDVYSFGVVLVELLTGKKAVVQTESDNGRSLVSWFLSSMENSDLYDILADRVVNEAKKETISAIANLARQSLNMDGKQRPTMRQVLLELEAISHDQGATISFLKSASAVREQAPMGTSIIDGVHDDASVPCCLDDTTHNFSIHEEECSK